MDVKIEPSWKERLQQEFEKPYFEQLVGAVRREYVGGVCYPPGRFIFNAFNQTPFDRVKVVILGQDPYHEPGQAHGLSFSVQDGVPFPPSLQNIFKEIQDDLGTPIPPSGNLTRWAEQGVLLLNATLTVRAHQANSHATLGWQQFTDAAIHALGRVRSRQGVDDRQDEEPRPRKRASFAPQCQSWRVVRAAPVQSLQCLSPGTR